MNKIQQATQICNEKRFVKTLYLSTPGDGFRYVRYRILRPLLKLYTFRQRAKFRPSPWLTPASIHIFNAILDTSMTGLEYGSGSSTLFFAPRLNKLVSIEHNPDWYKKVIGMLEEANYENVDLLLIPEHEPEGQFLLKDHSDFTPKLNYSKYFNKVLDFDDLYFDFILIDGRARVECLVNALPKLKSGGILALDNSERERYMPVFRILQEWKRVDTTNGLTNTTIWFKP